MYLSTYVKLEILFRKITTHRKNDQKFNHGMYNNGYAKNVLIKSAMVNNNVNQDLHQDETYSKHKLLFTHIIGSGNMSVISQNGQFKNLKRLGAYFSEKDLKPKFTESVLQQHRESKLKFSEEEDELLEMIDHPTMRSNELRAQLPSHKPSNHDESINKDVQIASDITEETGKEQIVESQQEELRNQKFTELLNEPYVDHQRKFNASAV